MFKQKVLPVILGVLAGFLIVMIGDLIAMILHPPPENFDSTNKEQLAEMVKNIPNGIWFIFLTSWTLSSFTGGLVTSYFGKEKWKSLCLITGGILLIGNIANMFMIPHPIWLMVITLVIYIPAAYFGGSLIKNNNVTVATKKIVKQ